MRAGFNVISLPPGGWWSFLVMVPFRGPWRLVDWALGAGMTMWTLVTGSPCGWACELPPTQPPRLLCSRARWAVMAVTGESSWLVPTEQAILFTWWLNHLSAEISFWWALTWDTNISTFFSPILRGLSTSSPPYFLVISFPITCFSGLSWQTSGPSAWNIHNHTPGHFPSKQSTAKGRAQSSTHWKACPHSCPSLGMSPRSAMLQLSTCKWCLHIMQNHL